MPTVVISLVSQRSRPVPDRVTWIQLRGRLSGLVNPADVVLKPAAAEVVMDLIPDRYTIEIDIPGFKPTKGTFDVGVKPLTLTLPLQNDCTLLPKVSELVPEQRRLLQTLDIAKTPAEIWNSLPDNKAATFFQVTYALANVLQNDGTPLSMSVDRIVRLAGSEMTAPDTTGVTKTVIGWRMHVVFTGGQKIEGVLESCGFKRDTGEANPVHKRFGFARSYREKGAMPRMQVATNYEGSAADVDLDSGAFHLSSPHLVYKDFSKRFPAATKVFKVR